MGQFLGSSGSFCRKMTSNSGSLGAKSIAIMGGVVVSLPGFELQRGGVLVSALGRMVESCVVLL